MFWLTWILSFMVPDAPAYETSNIYYFNLKVIQ